MKQQQGAALVIVMALLAGSMTLGLSGMQTALVDERLAGNYRASTQARMNAEIAAANALAVDDLDFFVPDISLGDLQSMHWAELAEQFSGEEQALNYGCERDGQPECVYIPITVSEGRYVMAKGVTGKGQQGGAESNLILLRYVMGGETQQPFGAALTSCQDITLRGSASIEGGVVAGNNLMVNGDPSPPTTAYAGGQIEYPDWWRDQHSQTVENYQDGEDGYRFSEDCDSLGVLAEDEDGRSYFEAVKAGLSVTGAAEWLQARGLDHYYQESGNALTLTGGSGNRDASTSYLGEAGSETSLTIDKDLKTGGRLQRLVVDGTVNLFVDGDFDLGGNTSLEISKDAVLNLYVSGEVLLSAGSQLALGAENFMRQDNAGVERPAVSIYSDYQQVGKKSGVTIGGSNDTYAAIYAPGSDVDIGGSGSLYGGLRARNVVMSGGSSLDYVDDLADYEVSTGDQGSDEPRFNEWTEVQ
ncbi:MAG: pilus assembly PilX family protein [Pseudomonadota bacterium]